MKRIIVTRDALALLKESVIYLKHQGYAKQNIQRLVDEMFDESFDDQCDTCLKRCQNENS